MLFRQRGFVDLFAEIGGPVFDAVAAHTHDPPGGIHGGHSEGCEATSGKSGAGAKDDQQFTAGQSEVFLTAGG